MDEPDAAALAARVVAATADHEFASWQLACRPPRSLEGEERSFFAAAVRRAVGAVLAEGWPAKERKADDAELSILLDLGPDRIVLDSRPLCFASRYRKLDRSHSQTIFHCRRCRGRGRGCATCGGSGLLVPHSVEAAVVPALVAQARASGARFHGMGREDVDVRMLGRGRPFIVELLEPRVRSLDLAAARAAVHPPLEIEPWERCERRAIKALKAATPDKTYRARIACEGTPSDEQRAAVEAALKDRALAQRNPSRVPRRADVVRTRTVRWCRFVAHEPLTVELRTESGTYIKELISGDEGRTEPSIAGLLGMPCRCEELDVLEIHA